MIHVAHIIPTLSFGGAEHLVIDLVNFSNHKKFKFSIITLFDNMPLREKIERKDVGVFLVPKKGKLSFHLRNDLREKLRELKPDIVHTHLFGADLWGRLAARDLDLQVVTTEHNLNYDYGSWRTLIRKLMKNYSKKYVACSQSVADYVSNTYGIKQDKIEVIKNGVKLEKFAMSAPAWQEPLRFAMIGRLTKQKGQEIALRALANLKHLPWELEIVGSGEDKQKLGWLIKEAGLEERFRSGAYPDECHGLGITKDVAEVLARTDVVLMPSLWEGLGVVAMETMSAGRLIVASNTGGLKEIIEDKKTGLLIKPGDVDEWTKIITEVIGNSEMCRTIAQAGQNFARENFGLEKTIAQYGGVYEVLVNHLTPAPLLGKERG